MRTRIRRTRRHLFVDPARSYSNTMRWTMVTILFLVSRCGAGNVTCTASGFIVGGTGTVTCHFDPVDDFEKNGLSVDHLRNNTEHLTAVVIDCYVKPGENCSTTNPRYTFRPSASLGDYDLRVSNVTVNDSGLYHCKQDVKTAISCWVEVAVNATSTTPPTDDASGSSADLPVIIGGVIVAVLLGVVIVVIICWRIRRFSRRRQQGLQQGGEDEQLDGQRARESTQSGGPPAGHTQGEGALPDSNTERERPEDVCPRGHVADVVRREINGVAPASPASSAGRPPFPSTMTQAARDQEEAKERTSDTEEDQPNTSTQPLLDDSSVEPPKDFKERQRRFDNF